MKGGAEKGEDESLEYFNLRTKERNRTKRARLVGRFVRFQDGHDMGRLPQGGNVGL